MKVELITVKYGGTVPTVQYHKRELSFEAVVAVEEGEDLQQVQAQILDMLAGAYEAEEATIKAKYALS